MITNATLYLIYQFINLVLFPIRSLADVSLPSDIASSISTVAGYLGSIDSFIPIGTILTIFGTILSIELGIFTYKIIMWLIKRLPTQS